MTNLRRLSQEDLPRLRQFWIEHWGGEEMFSRDNVYRPEQVEGFVIEDGREWIALLTLFIQNGECEVTSLDSLREGQGLGGLLIEKAVAEARARKCKRLFLITTNDNLRALGFYQKRGLQLVTIYRGAVDELRKQKPERSACRTERHSITR